jgi:hypothetical protein
LANVLVDSGILFQLKKELALLKQKNKNSIEYIPFSDQENNLLMEK